MQGFNPITLQEYNQGYYTQPYGAFTNQLQPTQLQPLPPAVNVSDLITPMSDMQRQSTAQPVNTGSNINILSPDKLGNLSSFTGIRSAVDNWGANTLGIGQQVAGPTTGAATGVQGVSGGLSSHFNLKTGIAGFAGTQAANILGLSGRYSGITGSLGAVGGTVAGAKMGTIAGMAGGPVGAALGGFVGSALGGVFGRKKPNPASVVGSNQGITAAGTFADGGTIRSKHAGGDFASTMRDKLNMFNSSIHEQTGLNLSDTIQTLYSGYDVNHGPGFISFNGYYRTDHEHHNPENFFTFDPNNPQSMAQAFRNYGSKLLQSTGQEFSPEQIQSIVNNAMGSLNIQGEGQSQRAIPRGDTSIAVRTEQGNRFTEFLADYNKQYNERAV